jgi:hypothetical protein
MVVGEVRPMMVRFSVTPCKEYLGHESEKEHYVR